MAFPFDSRVGQIGNYINPFGDRCQRTQRSWNAGQIRMPERETRHYRLRWSSRFVEDHRASLRVQIEKDGKENLILNPFAFPNKRSNVRSFVLPVIPVVRNSCALPGISLLVLLLFLEKKKTNIGKCNMFEKNISPMAMNYNQHGK